MSLLQKIESVNEIATSQEPVARLARRFSVTENEPQAKFWRCSNGKEFTDRYVWLYNDPLPLPALGARPPFQAMKEMDEKDHGLFHERPYDHPGLDK